RDRAEVEGRDLSPGVLDAVHELVLDGDRAHEPVEVRDQDHVGAAGLDGLDGGEEAAALGKRAAAGDVPLLVQRDELEAFAPVMLTELVEDGPIILLFFLFDWSST